jgi:hypothetical protein
MGQKLFFIYHHFGGNPTHIPLVLPITLFPNRQFAIGNKQAIWPGNLPGADC